jgi:hypothetical protein
MCANERGCNTVSRYEDGSRFVNFRVKLRSAKQMQTQHRSPQHGEENGGDPGEAYVIHRRAHAFQYRWRRIASERRTYRHLCMMSPITLRISCL